MLVAVCIVYIALVFPVRFIHFKAAVFPNPKPEGREAAKELLVWTLCLMSLYVNHAANFYVYVISGSEFRRELRLMVSEAWCGKKDLYSQSTARSKSDDTSEKASSSNMVLSSIEVN